MRKSLILAASLGTMIISSAAFAAVQNDTGAIKSIDAKANTITLADGKTFILPKGFKLETLKAGEKVVVAYEVKSGKMEAVSVKAE
jgi:Cu/Ag efflux protein CusF